MNKAITDGLVLTPSTFASGLNVWSSEDGTPGSTTYDGASNAALVTGDEDFGTCLEIVKNDTTTKLRFMGETPLEPGMYLQITARVKAISGNLPTVRIAGWAGDSTLSNISTVTQTGSETSITAYNDVVEVSAIVGSGERGGVDMPWGTSAVYGHFGLDLTGSNGGTVRIDDIEIEDVTSYYLNENLASINVEDYGAVGDGTTDCSSAFIAADAAANGKRILVPDGTFYLSQSITMVNEVFFEGTISQADGETFILQKGYDYNAYLDAFDDEVLAFKKAFQALLRFSDHDNLDLCGRRIHIDEPLDLYDIASGIDTFEVRRVIRNGQFDVQSSSNFDAVEFTDTASYSIAQPLRLSNISNIANVTVGTRISGTGVGREVYVTSVNTGAGYVTLSNQLYGVGSSQTYTFTRNKYILDFSGFAKMSQFELMEVEFLLNGEASGVMLPPEGTFFLIQDCHFKKPRERGVTSPGEGCQDLTIDRCKFTSNEQSTPVVDRSTIAFNVNANDAKIRNSRFVRFGHTAIINGTGHLISGNHWFQGDDESDSTRTAGVVLTNINCATTIVGNYIDNSYVELTNEHDSQPDFGDEFSFGGLTMTGNTFISIDTDEAFAWIVVTPYGDGHFIQGLNVTGNTFRSFSTVIDRVEKVDTTYADLDYSRMRNIVFRGNTYNGVAQTTFNPVTLDFTQSSESQNWLLDPSGYLPFGGWSRTVESVVYEGAITTSSDEAIYTMPYITNNYSTDLNQILVTFSEAVKGTVVLTVRMDNPV